MPNTPQRLDDGRIIANRAYGSNLGHAIDPTCGREVDPNEDVTEQVDLNGRTYYFCSARCRSEFESKSLAG